MAKKKLPRFLSENLSKKSEPDDALEKKVDDHEDGCICVQNGPFWYCMERMLDGSLRRCNGPFETREECREHTCDD